MSDPLPEKVQEWLKQPGAVLPGIDREFIGVMREYARLGVGYGFMQQVAEWLWDEKEPGGAWGPEWYQKRLEEAERQRDQLLAACEATMGSNPFMTGKDQTAIDTDAWQMIRAAIASVKEVVT